MLPINQRYFSSKNDSVEVFSAYMQEVNLKVLQFSIYFTYVSVSGLMYAQEISAFKICGVVPWRDSVRNIILLHLLTYLLTYSMVQSPS